MADPRIKVLNVINTLTTVNCQNRMRTQERPHRFETYTPPSRISPTIQMPLLVTKKISKIIEAEICKKQSSSKLSLFKTQENQIQLTWLSLLYLFLQSLAAKQKQSYKTQKKKNCRTWGGGGGRITNKWHTWSEKRKCNAEQAVLHDSWKSENPKRQIKE